MPRQFSERPATEQIALRAYFIWAQRGCSHGGDVSDWLQAESELFESNN
ncbi:MAG: DUF2934 domain-containing protein [Candidatus Melainabacteria bacterium]|nr:DUF2934 domain-containing protein [Candidatus Melainabacteria bacterium]